MIPQVWHYVAAGTIRVNPRLAKANLGLMRENPDCDWTIRYLALGS
jgi:hypothetical protein